MAIQCKYCGTELAKDDARFCNNCGMLVPSHPFSPQSLSALKSDSRFPFASSAREQPEDHKRVLHEQVAELTPARPTQEDHSEQSRLSGGHAVREEPVEIEKLATNGLSRKEEESQENLPEVVEKKLPETPKPVVREKAAPVAYRQMTPLVSPRQIPGVRRKTSGPMQLSPAMPAWPAPVTHISVKGPAVSKRESLSEQKENVPAPEIPNSKATPAREFHIGIWEDSEMRELTDDEWQSIENTPTRAVAAVSAPVEDAPTQEVSAPVEDAPTQEVSVPVEDAPTQEVVVPPAENRSPMQGRAVEQVQPSPFLSVPSSQTAAQEMLAQDWRVRSRAVAGPADPSLFPAQPNATPFGSSAGYQPAYMPGTMTGEKGSAGSAPLIRRRGRRWPVVVTVVVLLVILAAGGVGALLVLSQQSGTDPMAQPQVSFVDAQLGISLLYPNGWIKQVEAAKSTAHFYASNHVGQVDVIVATGSGDVKQALQQQGAKMGMSGTKTGTSLNFAGASWQQLQGTMQQSGASYNDTILATTHGDKLFMIVQQAPQSNYADWEKEFFVPMRASFKFA